MSELAVRNRRIPFPVVLAGVLAVLVVVAVAQLLQGRTAIGLSNLLDYVRGDASTRVRSVLDGARLPRLAAGVLSGSALGVAGLLLQSATRNRLVEPTTMGIGAGAFLAVAIATVTGVSLEGAPRGLAAFCGGLIAACVVLAASRRGSPTRIVLAGVAVSLTAASTSAALLVVHEQRLSSLFLWGFGSLVQSGYARITPMLVLVAIGAVAAFAIAARLDVLALGDDAAASLGVGPARTRAIAVGAGVLLTAASVAVTGPIGFIGLLAPLIARAFGPRSTRATAVLVAGIGAAVLVGADTIGQLLRGGATATELPVGVVTALVGAPVLILLARSLPTLGPAPALATRGRRPVPYPVVLVGSMVVLAVAVVGALLVGDVPLSVGDVVRALLGGGDSLTRLVVVDLRLPRVGVAALAGGLLAVCGVALQGVVRNPLADASLLGITGGASVGALFLVLSVPGVALGLVPFAAFAGAGVAVTVVVLLAWHDGLAPERLALVGISMAAFATALTDTIVVANGFRFAEALVWLAGSTYGRDSGDLVVLAVCAAAVGPLVWLAGPNLDVLALGDDVPRALGTRIQLVRVTVVALACILGATTVAVVGVIGFVGLLAPHIVRRLVGPVHRLLVPVAALAGASLVVAADALGRVLVAPDEVPAGLLVAVVGAPFVVHLLWRSGRDG